MVLMLCIFYCVLCVSWCSCLLVGLKVKRLVVLLVWLEMKMILLFVYIGVELLVLMCGICF